MPLNYLTHYENVLLSFTAAFKIILHYSLIAVFIKQDLAVFCTPSRNR